MSAKITAKENKNRFIAVCMAAFVLVLFIFLYFFNRGITIVPLYGSSGTSFEKARVVEILQDNLQEDGTRAGSQIVKVELLSGPHKSQIYGANSLDSYLYGAACRVGTRVIVQTSEFGDTVSVSVYNYDRSSVLYLLIAVFVFFLWLIGGRKGIKSALSLAFSFVCILFLYLPMLYIGCSAFWAAVVVVALTTIVSFYLLGGATIKTAASIISTIAGVIVAGLIATSFGGLAHLSGYNVSDVENLIYISQNCKLDVGGLLFSGILIAALGAAMDNSFSIASAVNELHERSPLLTRKQMFQSGINVGRDIMNSTTNTLIFAYAGTSVTVLISMYAYHYPYNQVINMYSIGIELLQALSGTLGVILTVPICSAVSAWMFANKANAGSVDIPANEPGNKENGEESAPASAAVKE